MKTNVKIQFDENKVSERLKKKIELCQKVLDLQVLKDSNYFAPHRNHYLIPSGIEGTEIGSGKVIWLEDYAHLQYYNYPKKYLGKNPNARMKWFEEAKSRHLKDWIKLVNDTYNRNP